MSRLTLLLIPLLFFMTSCTIDWNDEKDVNTPVSHSTAVDTKIFTWSNYTFVYPATASSIDTSGVMWTTFLAYLESNSTNQGFNNNVNLLLQKSTPETDNLQAFKKLSEDQVKQLITGWNLIKSTIEKDSRWESYIFMHYTWKLWVYNLEWHQRTYYKNNIFYVLTLTEAIGSTGSTNNDTLLYGLSFHIK